MIVFLDTGVLGQIINPGDKDLSKIAKDGLKPF